MIDDLAICLLYTSFRIGGAFPDLTFNGFFALTISRIAGIDHGGHGRHLPFIHH